MLDNGNRTEAGVMAWPSRAASCAPPPAIGNAVGLRHRYLLAFSVTFRIISGRKQQTTLVRAGLSPDRRPDGKKSLAQQPSLRQISIKTIFTRNPFRLRGLNRLRG